MFITRIQLFLLLTTILMVTHGCSDQAPEQPTYFMTATINTGEELTSFNGTFVDEVSIGVIGLDITVISVDDVEKRQRIVFAFPTIASVPDTLLIGLFLGAIWRDDLIIYEGTDGSMTISALSGTEVAGTFEFNATAIAPASGTVSVVGSFDLAAGSEYSL